MKVIEKPKHGNQQIEYNYLCGYCGNIFDKVVTYFDKGTTPVVCPRCGNFLKVDSGK